MAHCAACDNGGRIVPNMRHAECGIYGIKNFQPIRPWMFRGPTIVGEVALWGRIYEYEHGWRAQYAYPINLHVLPMFITGNRKQRLRDDDQRWLVRELKKYGIDTQVASDGLTRQVLAPAVGQYNRRDVTGPESL